MADMTGTSTAAWGKHRFLWLGIIAAVCTMVRTVYAVGAPPAIPIEYQVKSAFLYRFINFIEWPDERSSPDDDSIIIGIIGKSPMHAALVAMAESRAYHRRLIIRAFSDPKDLRFCHILFIGVSEKRRSEEILKRLGNSSTLTVSEVEGFAHRGGMINFVIIDDMMRFEISVSAAEKANLKISSKLLRLARIVDGNE